MASKIKKEMSPEQVVDLLHDLASTPGGDVLRVIQQAAAKRGISVSLMSATSFRDEELRPYLDKLKFARAKSQALAELVTAGDETGALAGSRLVLAEAISDFLMADGRQMGIKDFASLSKALQSLTSANTGTRMTAARVRELEAREEERKAAAAKLHERKEAVLKKGGVSEEALRIMEEAVGLLS